MRCVISACLAGEAVRYDGRAKTNGSIQALIAKRGVEHALVCPEVLGGLEIPRLPAEIKTGRVIREDGQDMTDAYVAGAERAYERACAELGGAPDLAILKAKSPACGTGQVYDGSFSRQLIAGDGIFVSYLKQRGIVTMSELDLESYQASVEHPLAIILGAGLGSLASELHVVRRIPYADIEGFPDDAPALTGHTYEAYVGTLGSCPVLVYPGRIHLYQGASAAEVTSLVRHAHKLGARSIVFANASAAVGETPLGLGLYTDQINLSGTNPLIERAARRTVDTPFVDMDEPYSPYLQTLAQSAARELGITLNAGVFAQMLGPSFETPAEGRMLTLMGVNYAGMSVANECIMARALDMHTLGLTVATHKVASSGISHESILTSASAYKQDFEALIKLVADRLSA